MPAQLTPQTFAAKWAASKLKETAAYQEHFLDLCHLLDQPTPAEADPGGSFYTFQKGVIKTGGPTEVDTLFGPVAVGRVRKGFADVWYHEHFGCEYKGRGGGRTGQPLHGHAHLEPGHTAEQNLT